jgi:mono/diheme cytochrome c family protein
MQPARITNHRPAWAVVAFLAVATLFTGDSARAQDKWVCPAGLASTGTAATTTVATVAHGKELAHQSCAECHGQMGLGDGPAAAGMTPRPANWQSRDVQGQSDACLFWKLSTGRGNMPPAGRMPETDRWSIVRYIRSLKAD